MKTTMGEEIRRLRLSADITLRAFARLLDISASHQSDIEHGRRMPSDDLLRAIAQKLAHVGASYDSLKELDSRLGEDLERWIQKTPEAGQMLRATRASGQPVKDVLQKLRRLLDEEDKD